MRRSLAVLLLVTPMFSGCAAAVCCTVALHPVKTANAIEYGAERLNPRKRAEDFKRITEGDLRDRDYTAYIAFVIAELRLKDVLQYEMAKEGYTFGYRVATIDSFAGPDGFAVTGRMEVIPDYGLLVNEGVKSAFGFWGKLLPDRLVTRIGRDLTIGNRFVGQFLDVGVDEADLDFYVATPAGEVYLGRARTDIAGRATLSSPAAKLPDLASGSYPVVAKVAPSHLPPGLKAGTKIDAEGGGILFVRGADAAPAKVVVVNVSNTLFRLDGPKAAYRALVDKQYDLVDACAEPALRALEKDGFQIVLLSGTPEGMTPLMRDELTRHSILDRDARSVPMIFKPMDLALDRENQLAFKTHALEQQKKFWGADAVQGYIADDASVDLPAANAAGVHYLALPKAGDGGWCAGMPPLVPVRKIQAPAP